MALRPPETPSLHFKEREGFITDAGDEEPVEEEEEPVEEEEEFEGEEETAEDEFWEDEEESAEEVEEEIVEEEPVEEEAVEEEQAPPPKTERLPLATVERREPTIDRREPTVIVQPPDAGGRTGTALPTPQEMQEYAQPEDRGQAIIRHFEEEDRRMNEQLEAATREPESSSIFEFHAEPPDIGGGKWLLLIAALTILGYTVVRQLAMNPVKPSEARKNELSIGREINKKPPPPPPSKPPTEHDKLKSKMVQRPSVKPSKEELIAKAVQEVRAASEQPEVKKPPRPRPTPKPEPKKDDIKHIEIRI